MDDVLYFFDFSALPPIAQIIMAIAPNTDDDVDLKTLSDDQLRQLINEYEGTPHCQEILLEIGQRPQTHSVPQPLRKLES